MTMLRLSDGFEIVSAIPRLQNVQTGSPARPQGRKNRRRTLLGTLRIFPTRERRGLPVETFSLHMYPPFRSSSIPRPPFCARPDLFATAVGRNSSMMSSTYFGAELICVVAGA